MKTRYRMEKGVIFQRREEDEQKYVTERSLRLAKPIASVIVRANMRRIQDHFVKYAMRKYRCKRSAVTFDDRGALRRLRYAVLGEDEDGIYGHTDGKTILINSAYEMGFSDIVPTLVHECLHDFCIVRGKKMGCDREHVCMRGLGEE